MTQRLPAVGLATAVALLAVPAAASAVTLSANRTCYTHLPTKGSEPIVTTLAGGTPGANFIVAATAPGKGLGSAGSATGTFDAAGNGTAQIMNVSPPSGTINPTKGQTVRLSVRDFGAGGAAVDLAQVQITNLALDVKTTPRSPRKRRQVTISGTPFAGQRLYGFVVKGTSRRVLRRVSLGRANACGYVKSRQVVAPRSFRRGTYRFYVNPGRSLAKSKSLGTGFTIRRTF